MDDFDWTDAYENGAYIPDAASYPPAWQAAAEAFRAEHPDAELDLAYGTHERQRLDLFRPDGPPAGLAVFVHGGYWMKFDKSLWSHLARGALARGWAVALPGYRLAPEARLSWIAEDIGRAIDLAASHVDGPVRLAGHSAGGHLVARMACQLSPLPAAPRLRLAGVLSISGLHDLHPLRRTAMNDTLAIDDAEADAESPALLTPIPGVPVTAWVGADERPEFLRQARLLSDAWPDCREEIDPGRHHFDVIAGLEVPDSPITRAFVGETGAD
ncbi:alpha/beta hydrolase [Psychromarinibacter sp. C21-152]|uniref:Alpha/beta hydrolase n=1 Tax=Psychromarinibacter sediminicola TaxID=3033385 RepID=A0AAE3T7T5_9RHOB|nr:alpha/beta hydrolase [Psychromarinibacter sediminicola]MDF0599364.1 alpha/beta hydrolase [Psychromarinibacter sediminicola]